AAIDANGGANFWLTVDSGTNWVSYLMPVVSGPRIGYANWIDAKNSVVYIVGAAYGGPQVPIALYVSFQNPFFAITSVDDRIVYTNTGTVGQVHYHLPASPTVGQMYHFYVDESVGLEVVAAGSQTIRIGSVVSAAGGSVESTVSGAWL